MSKGAALLFFSDQHRCSWRVMQYCASAAHDQTYCGWSLTVAIRDFDGSLIQSLVDLRIHT